MSQGKQATSPKFCSACGKQGGVIDSRHAKTWIRRTYRCPCGHKWTTAEFNVEEGHQHSGRKTEAFLLKRDQVAVTHLKARIEAAVDDCFVTGGNTLGD